MNHRPSLIIVLVCTWLCGAATLADDERSPEKAVAALDVADGLEATLFASEPMLLNPTNIDVDHLGRVWVAEVVNYRGQKGTRPEGDRILVLEDSDGDGKADRQTVFYQGTDIDSAMGVCVLGNRVIVSASPNVYVFTDSDGDLKADKKEVLFSKTGQEQHDHSAHAFTFGPDGKLYWNFGNTGMHVHDKDGKPVVDVSGKTVVDDGKPYFGGMAFRCNLDGSEFEVLAHNFRNIYEVAVDSFGTLWQSDNDDDGNRGVRINYLMEHGNFGYRDEMTGAGWHTPYLGMPGDIPLRHWHLTDPGVVPNLLQTGAGSPTGIVVYEGNLLPEVFRGQIIHCDAGPNVVRAYPVQADGAGYKATTVNILDGAARDQWFRPSDVCVAPDGSLIVADWYDPGVGGHHMGDAQKGRLFRVAPPKTPYRAPKHDFSSPENAALALHSPNLATRYLAWTALHGMKEKAEPALSKLYEQRDSPRMRARALWLLGQIPGHGETTVQQALGDKDADIRIAGLRLARSLKLDVIPFVRQLIGDASPQVRRECALALHGQTSHEAAQLWAMLAAQHDGKDRWYLEALGIGAAGNWDVAFDEWVKTIGQRRHTAAGRDIVWRSRAAASPRYLAAVILTPLPMNELPRYLRAFDFQTSHEKNEVLDYLAFRTLPRTPAQMLVAAESLKRLGPFKIADKPDAEKVLGAVLDGVAGTADFVALVDRFDVEARYADLTRLAAEKSGDDVGIQAVAVLLRKGATSAIEDALKQQDAGVVHNTLAALGNSADGRALGLIFPVFEDAARPVETRREAVRALAKSRAGALKLMELAEANKLDAKLQQAAAAALCASFEADVRSRAEKLFPPAPGRDNQPLPPIGELVRQRGDVSQGKLIFNTTGTCLKCHLVNEVGKDVGPNLSEIGDKLSRQALFDSILFPSAGISHNYETYLLLLENGTTVTGLLTSRTAEEITLKMAEGATQTFKTAEVEEIHKQDISLMPADLHKLLSVEELVNLVEYMSTLKKAKGSAGPGSRSDTRQLR
ncbi:MAG: PVC-type heme-binding CxxCH protein [Planctomycetaceae bacterium]